MQDVIDAERVPLGAPPAVVKFCPDKMPEYWVADLVKREVKSLDAEDLMDAVEVKIEVEHEKVQARVGPLQV